MKTENKTSLPTKLAFLRKQKGLTQMELAEKLNVSRQAISRWEVGAAVPSTDNLKVLGDLYGVSVDYLLDDNTRDAANNVAIEQPKLEDRRKFDKREKYRNFVIGIAIVLIALVLVGAGLSRKAESNRESVLPMENMTVGEVEENLTVTFPFE